MRLPDSISKTVIALLMATFVLSSCKENKSSNVNTETTEDKTLQEMAVETEANIDDYYPGPNFMKILADENNGLDLSEVQKSIFEDWRKENHSKIEMKMKEVASLEKGIKLLSQNKADASEILDKTNAAESIRKEIAMTKLLCRNHIIETLRPEQWDALIAKYENDFPFVVKTKMMDVVQHVNPVPNYTQVINKNIDGLQITPEQKSTFDAWSTEHHPQMMEMANKVIALEKEIYLASLEKQSNEVILEKIDEISKLRNDIVTMKTQCRDMVVENLKPEQWASLVEKTNY
ncbi:MAG: hypothetical protein WBM83_13790 [Flavobacteriaceae bacterium]